MSDALARLFAAFPFIAACGVVTALFTGIALCGGAWLWRYRGRPRALFFTPILCAAYGSVAVLAIRFLAARMP